MSATESERIVVFETADEEEIKSLFPWAVREGETILMVSVEMTPAEYESFSKGLQA